MVRQTVAVKRGGYRLTINIPIEWWSGTDTVQTEKTRALRRARIRRYAKDKWRNLKTMKQAWKVERFLAVVTVSAPPRRERVPSTSRRNREADNRRRFRRAPVG